MKTAMVTGGAKRVGADISKRLVNEGFKVAIHYNKSLKEAHALKEELNINEEMCEIFQGDLTKKTDLTRVFDESKKWLGHINVCINNASMFVNDDIVGISNDLLNDHFSINLKAPIFLSELMHENSEGLEDCLIINMLDNKVFALNPDFFSYTISKSALLAATEMLAMRFGGRPRVCGIAPSVMLVSGDQTHQNFIKSSKMNLLNRQVDPKEIANTVVYMWETKSYNKQILTIDGGQTLMDLPRDVAFLAEKDVTSE